MRKALLIIHLLVIPIMIFAQSYEPGDKAQTFKLKNIDGKYVSPDDYKNAKGFIVIFTCNHCPYAVAYEDRIIKLDKTFKVKGYPVIAINPNDPVAYPTDSFKAMKERAKEKGFTFPYLIDETQEIAEAYGAKKTPHVFLLQKEAGKLIVKYVGAIDDNYQDPAAVTTKYVSNAIKSLLENKSIETTSTKAIGCSIKWKE